MKKIFFIFSVVVFGILSFSCGKKSGDGIEYFDEVAEECAVETSGFVSSNRMASKKMMVAEAPAVPQAVYADEAYIADDYEMDVMENDIQVFEEEISRKLVKNGNLTLEVESFAKAETEVEEFVKSFKGYITDTSLSDTFYSVTLRIPADRFEEAMSKAGNLGTVKFKSENSYDVTQEFYDLDSRLSTKKVLKEKLESYLTQAADMKDLLEVERQLNMVISDLEAMESQMKVLSKQIDYSTIYVSMNLPVGHVEEGYKWPDWKEKFGNLGVRTVEFLSSLAMFMIYIVVIGIPLLVVVAFLYWLLFGKIGLLVKLFRKLKK